MGFLFSATVFVIQFSLAFLILWYITKDDMKYLIEDIKKNGWEDTFVTLPYGLGVFMPPPPKKKEPFVKPSRTKKRNKGRK